MKIAFLGSAEFSNIVLQQLYNSKHKIVCVVTNLDKESGRGHKIIFSPVKQFAREHDIPVLQYKKVSAEGYDDIKALNPDVLITASFGQILKQNILDLAPYGVVNVHSSLLPKYRGSCPVNWAIINGEQTTGVTIMKTNIGLDTGDIMLSEEVNISPIETTGELLMRLADIGGKLLLNALEKLENNQICFKQQDESQSSYYPMLNKEMGKIDFNKNVQEIINLVRGLNPWPVCYFKYLDNNLDGNETIIKVYKAKYYNPTVEELENFKNFKVGQVVLSNSKKGLVVKCADGYVLLEVIQAPNSKQMTSQSYLNGKSISVFTQLN